MTPAEYIQLKAFARVDGASLSVLWILSFALYIIGISTPVFGMFAIVLAVLTPFFVARRLLRFRDEDRAGVISFGRGYAYSVLVFFYAGILLALAQYVYFAYMDQGFLLSSMRQMMESDEGRRMIESYGVGQMVDEGFEEMAALRPIDYALNMLTVCISFGVLLGLPIAALAKRRIVSKI